MHVQLGQNDGKCSQVFLVQLQLFKEHLRTAAVLQGTPKHSYRCFWVFLVDLQLFLGAPPQALGAVCSRP